MGPFTNNLEARFHSSTAPKQLQEKQKMVWVETPHVQKRSASKKLRKKGYNSSVDRHEKHPDQHGSVDAHEKLPDQPTGNENGWKETNHFIRRVETVWCAAPCL